MRCSSSAIIAFMRSKRIEPLLQKLPVVDDLLLEVLALFAHGLTAGSGGSNALSVIDRCRGRAIMVLTIVAMLAS
jgi:hypothetical protein